MKKRITIYITLILIFLTILITQHIQEISQYYYVKTPLNPTQLTKMTVEKYVTSGKVVKLKAKLLDASPEKAGTFVTIYKQGKLRGCIGTIQPTEEDVREEIVRNAIRTTSDYRFTKILPEELDKLSYTVDILSPLEKVNSIDELNSEMFGVVITADWGKMAVLLPNIKYINSVEEQLAHTKKVAKIKPDEEFEIRKFTTIRFSNK